MPLDGASVTSGTNLDPGRGASSLAGLLRKRAGNRPDALVYAYSADGTDPSQGGDGCVLTLGTLDTRARALAAWMRERGLEGERVLLVFPPGLEFLAAFFGCLYAGVVAVPASTPRPNRPMTRLRAIVDDARPGRPPDDGGPPPRRPAVARGDPRARRHPLARRRVGSRRTSRRAGAIPARARRARLPPVHLGLDRRAQGGDGHPRQPAAQLGRDPPQLRRDRGEPGRLLAAALPRHGADRRRAPDALLRRVQHADVAGRVPPATRPLARGDLADRGDDQRRPELRLRPLRPQGDRRPEGQRSTSAAGRSPSTAPSRSAPRRSTASPRPSPRAASAARRSSPATAWPRRP